jgi:hypothetical protein
LPKRTTASIARKKTRSTRTRKKTRSDAASA